MISYAQNQEDVILARAFVDKTEGFYIDIGACFPEEGSVTKYFYDLGWHGINVEPDAQAFEMLAKERSKDINLNVAVTDVGSELRLYRAGSIGETSALAKEGASSFIVPALSLRDLCKQHVNSEIDFLKIDVEGFEFQVIQSGDWQQYRPRVVIIEVTFPWSSLIRPEAKQIEIFLHQHSYEKVYFDGLNYYFVALEAQDLAQKVALQPNILDNFLRSAEAKKQEELMTLQPVISDLKAKNHQLTTEIESVQGANNDLRQNVEWQQRCMQDLLNSRSYRLSRSLRALWVFLKAPLTGIRPVLTSLVSRLASVLKSTAPNLFDKIRRLINALRTRPLTTVKIALNRIIFSKKKTNSLNAQSAKYSQYARYSHDGKVKQNLSATMRKWQLGHRIDG
jgi:FkbM family methyltransferase